MKRPSQELIQRLGDIRYYLHQNPELSAQEIHTARFIMNELSEQTTADIITPIGGTGVLAVFKGKKKGPTILLRADTDALPIHENDQLAHRSKVEGVAHKCGHDGHTTIMLGVAAVLSERPREQGDTLLLFQPSEENGKGAKQVLQDPQFQKWKIDFAFALHNLPHFSKHQIVVRKGNFTANVKSLIIHLKGQTTHAAEPEHGQNPAWAIAPILERAKEMNHNQPEAPDFFLITPIHIQLGQAAYGTAAGEGALHFTLRSWDTALFQEKSSTLLAAVEEICEKQNLTYQIDWLETFDANYNDDVAVDMIQKAAQAQELEWTTLDRPFKWGEDFGAFSQRYTGAMFGIGAGEDCPALHHPDYDFPNEIIPTGIQMFEQIIREIDENT